MMVYVSLLLVIWMPGAQSSTAQTEREKAAARQQFVENFRDIQLLGQGLLRDHQADKLNPKGLSKAAKSINKCARTLRSLLALGKLASEIEIDEEIATPLAFDEAIRKLAGVISDFAHNPQHQNSKVLNTDQAAKAQTDLLTIINLSKVIEKKSNVYIPASILRTQSTSVVKPIPGRGQLRFEMFKLKCPICDRTSPERTKSNINFVVPPAQDNP
jgi:hypothetical protein